MQTLEANANVGSKRERWKQTRTLEGVENVVQELEKSVVSSGWSRACLSYTWKLERQKEEFHVKTKEIRGLNPPQCGSRFKRAYEE